MPSLKPFQLLEINIISAQDLEPVSKKMKTYATAWVHTNRKLSTSVDKEGNNNPTWNDKFVFRVDDEFLRLDISAVMIEIHAVQWFRNTLVGTVRILVGNLIPPPTRSHHHHLGMRFVALQIRRPSGRPQGILNIGVAVLDSSMRSMPLYTQLSTSAVGFHDLMGEEDPHNHHQQQQHNHIINQSIVKPILRRSRSERSDRITVDTYSVANSSMVVAVPDKLGSSSTLSISDFGDSSKWKNKKGKASSVISGSEIKESSKQKGKKGKASSLISYSVVSKEKDLPKPEIKREKVSEIYARKVFDEKPTTKETPKPTIPPPIPKPISKFNGNEFGNTKGNNKFIFVAPNRTNSLLSDSEVGPSPSEVAAAMVKKYPLEDNRSSVLDGWSVDESAEGLRSKLERWRVDLPPLYDQGLSSTSYRSTGRHARRHSDGGSGLFSCFGNIYGYECQCVCGKPPGKKGLNSRFHSPSIDSLGRPFL